MKGTTEVLHDTEGTHEVKHCDGYGCYNLTLNYTASLAQIDALLDASETCQQKFTVCF